MKDNKGHTGFEHGMRESFKDFAQIPDPAVWSGIQAALQSRKKVVLLYRLAFAATLALLFGIGGLLVFQTSDPGSEKPSPLATEQIIPQKPEPAEKSTQSETLPALDATALPAEKDMIAQTPAAKQKIPPATTEPVQPIATSQSDPYHVVEAVMQETEAELLIPDHVAGTKQEEIADAAQKDLKVIDLSVLLPAEDFLSEKPKNGSWQLALGYATIQGQAAADPSAAYKGSSADFLNDPYSSKLSSETAEFTGIENTTHSQPLTFGLILHRNFSDTWGLETGLLLTRLKTKSTTSLVRNEYAEYENELYYVGIPFTVRLNMIRGKRFGMYISQGAMLEKGIRNRFYSRQFAFDVLKSTEQKTYVAEGVQVSSLTALGFEYRLSKMFSLYAQPGLQIFFLNQTQPYNIRSSSAIWPSLQTGLKFQL